MVGDKEKQTCKWINELRLERRRRRLTRKQVASLIGKSVELVGMYERGDLMPPLATALKLAILYRTQVAAIYYELHRQYTVSIRQAEEELRSHSCNQP